MTASRGRDCGGPVFDSSMLKLSLCTLSLFPMWDSLPSFGVSPLLGSALDWGLSRSGQSVRAWLGTEAYVASQSALDWGLSRSGQSVRAWLGTEANVASQSALDWGLSRSGQSVRAWLGTEAYVASQSALDWGLRLCGESVRA
ncbi:hypothetical protein ACLB2K_062863 [Fragaria x ananassa]